MSTSYDDTTEADLDEAMTRIDVLLEEISDKNDRILELEERVDHFEQALEVANDNLSTKQRVLDNIEESLRDVLRMF